MPEGLEYIEVVFSETEPLRREILVAELSEMAFEGFEERDNNLCAYIPGPVFEEKKLGDFLKKLGIEFKVNFIKEQNWNLLWESSFQPVHVAEKVLIRADFHESDSNAEYDIIITPKMSFGTGHHETTMMMIEAMAKINCKGKTVLDFGTGTGILAIFAENLGAESVLAVDCDNWSIANAKENIAKNGCKRISLLQSDKLPACEKFDLILSNINKSFILDSVGEFSTRLNDKGTLIVSGLLDSDLDEVSGQFASHFGIPHLIIKKNNWGCLTFILERIEL